MVAACRSPIQDSFVPRLIYGAYLRNILSHAKAAHPALTVIQAHIDNITRTSTGFLLHGTDGQQIEARRVVLAMGNLPPGEGMRNPYDPALWAELAEPGDILIAGTGLTALDLLVTLAETKRQGTIHVMSRSGLFPQVHAPPGSYPQIFDGVDLALEARRSCCTRCGARSGGVRVPAFHGRR